MKENESVVKMEQSATTFDKFNSMEEMLSFAQQIVKSELSPIKKPEDVVAAILTGKEIGLGVMASLSNIYCISGKPTAGIHVISALLLKAGVTMEVVRDFEPVFPTILEYKEEGSTEVKKTGIIRHVFLDDKLEEDEKRAKTIVDYKTVIRFTRTLKQPDNSYSKMTITSSYSRSEAQAAGFLTKDNWIKHLKTMVRTRAIAIGSKLIGDDIILGLYETSEMADVANIPYKVEGDDRIVILEPNKNENKPSFDSVEDAKEVK